MVKPIRSCVTLKCFFVKKKYGEQKEKKRSKEWCIKMDPDGSGGNDCQKTHRWKFGSAGMLLCITDLLLYRQFT